MHSSSARTHQLGRQVWTTVRDSLESWASTLPSRTVRHHHLAGFRSRRSASSSSSSPSSPVTSSLFQPPVLSRRSLFQGTRRLFVANAPAPTSRISPNNIRRSCTSGGSLLLLGLSSPSTSPSSVVATCTAAADTALAGAATTPKTASIVHRLARQTWPCDLSRVTTHRGAFLARPLWPRPALRYKSTSSREQQQQQQRHSRTLEPDSKASNSEQGRSREPPPPQPGEPGEALDPESIASSMSKYLQSHLPKIPPRPTKEEFLAAATGFWQRTQARFKWHSIRSMRPWNADEWGAFVSWFMLGHLVWILVGTTTFFSLVILTINTVFAQEELAKWVGDYLTQSAGVTVVFESAIVPKWKDGVITFHNVFVSRRPGQVKSIVKKGSSSEAAMAAAQHIRDQDDGNYTQFDVTINSVDVTLSFIKWWNGKGLLKDVEVKGVRGVVDRTHVRWSDGPLDPFSFRHEHQPGDFEIERFKLEDLMVTVHQPNGFRPFSVSIFSCELPQLRKQWLFYDFLSANHVSGAYDGSLFTIHPRQVQRPVVYRQPGSDPAAASSSLSSMSSLPSSAASTISAAAAAVADAVVDNSHNNINNPANDPMVMALESPLTWKKLSRLRIDGLKIDHLNRGDRGPFGWIYEGNVDIVADVILPAEADDSIAKVMSDFYDKMEEAVTSNRYLRILDGNYGRHGNHNNSNPSNHKGHVDGSSIVELDTDHVFEDEVHVQTALSPSFPSPPSSSGPLPQYVIMDLRLHLNDVRAAVPFFSSTDTLGYVNAALIRPIVAYINAKRTYIPINCRIVKHLSDFDGSWTIYDCGLMDDSSAEVYAAFAHDVVDQQSRVRRLKKVGFWTLSMVVHALLAGVAGDLM